MPHYRITPSAPKMLFGPPFSYLLLIALSFAPYSALCGDVPPTIRLRQATVYGTTNGSVTSYLNIPFAEPPSVLVFSVTQQVEADYTHRIGDLRLRLPKPIDNYNGSINATQVGPQCIQLSMPLRQDMPAEMLRDVTATLNIESRVESEDCT